MKRVLVVHHTLGPPTGGGTAVGAWALEALKSRYEIHLLSWGPPLLEDVNQAFGTSLKVSDFTSYTVSPLIRRVVDMAPLPLALLSTNILYRQANQIIKAQPFEIILSTMNEIDIGRPAIQYVHFPWSYFPRPDADYRWYHFAPLLRAYRAFCTSLSGYRKETVAANVTLVNSNWTGQLFEEWYGAQAKTVYPPVKGGFPDVPVEERDCSFVCLGRISPEKEIEKVIAILAEVRRRGHPTRLHIVGTIDKKSYAAQVLPLIERNKDWVTFHRDLPRDKMAGLIARCRYGIHGMVGEHFGIAPAELQRAGCITLVPDDGGPTEIVGNDERVIYHSPEDAVAKIDRLLSDPAYEAEVRADLEARRELFTETRFMAEILEAVEQFSAQTA